MKVEVKCINERGRALFSSERKGLAPKHVGALVLQEERNGKLGRNTLVATLQDTRGGTRQPVLPGLFDAQVLWVRDGEIRIRGVEILDETEYSQCWEVKVLPC
jgi:hypothetical protein